MRMRMRMYVSKISVTVKPFDICVFEPSIYLSQKFYLAGTDTEISPFFYKVKQR